MSMTTRNAVGPISLSTSRAGLWKACGKIQPACTLRSQAGCMSGSTSASHRFLGHDTPTIHRAPCNNRNSRLIAAAGSLADDDNIQKEALGLRRISWISFWLQLALSIVSAIVLFFTASTASRGAFPQAPVFFNLGGVVLGFISTFLAYSRTRIARGVIEAGQKAKKSKVAADVLNTTRLNLIGLGATLIGLQSTVGGLVGKALTSSSAGAYNVQSAQNAPAALDVFAVQASTNTILLHFLGIVFANWTLRILNPQSKSPAPA